MKHLGKKPPTCEELGCEGYNTQCCSCGEYCCTTKKEEHYRQSLLEAADELDDFAEKGIAPFGKTENYRYHKDLAKRLRRSAGEKV